MKKILGVFLLTAILVFGIASNCYAAEEVTIHASTYSSGKPSKTNSGGSLGIVKGNTLGYKINIDGQVTAMNVTVACGGRASVDIYLDSVGGTLVGSLEHATGTTAWKKYTLSIPVQADMSGEHILYFRWNNTLDFISFTYTVTDEVSYAKFSEKDVFSDIADSDARTELNLLAELGIISAKSDDKFDGNVIATKRDFIRGISMFYNDKLAYPTAEQLFKDVSETDPDYQKIAWLCATGVLKADALDELKPDGAISVNEASEILCRLLGYEYKNQAGISYTVIAKRLGLLKNVSNVSPKLMKRIDMAWLLYNTIESKFDDIKALDYNGVAKYVTNEHILKVTRGVYRGEGVVSASEVANLYSSVKFSPKKTVEIDGEIYDIGKTNAINYIGFKCIFFYEEINGRKSLVAIRPEQNVEYLKLSTNETSFISFDTDEIVYYDEEKKDPVELEISGRTVVLYNGRPSGEKLSTLIGDPEYFFGELLLIDNDEDNEYDVIFVEQAETMIFGGVNNNFVYDLLTKKSVPVGDLDNISLFYNGIPCGWKSVGVGTVIDVYMSKNTSGDIFTRIYATGAEAIGYIKEMNNEDGIVLEDGTTYKPYKTTLKDPTPGTTVTLKLNAYGCYVDYSTDLGEKLALVLDCGANNLEGLSPEVGVRILTEENEITVLNFADKVYADGVFVTNSKDLWNGIGKFVGGLANRVAVNSVIRYAVNSDDKISMIDTKDHGAGGDKDTLDLLVVPPENGGYNIRNNIITNTSLLELGVLANDYKVIMIDKVAGETAHEFRGAFAASDQARNLAAYTTKGGTVVADLLVWTRSSSTATEDHFVLQTKGYTIDDDETAIMLRGISSAGEVTYIVDSDIYKSDADFRAKVDALLPGDIVQTALTSKDKISNIAIRYMRDGSESRSNGEVVPSIHDKKHIFLNSGNAYLEGKQYWCEIEGREDNVIIAKRINNTSGEWEKFYIDCSSVKVITVDTHDNYKATLDGSDTSRLTVGTQMIACCSSYKYVPYLLVVYK